MVLSRPRSVLAAAVTALVAALVLAVAPVPSATTSGVGTTGASVPVLPAVADGVRVVVAAARGAATDATGGGIAIARRAVEAAGGTVLADVEVVDGVVAEVPTGAVADLEAAAGVVVTRDAPVQVRAASAARGTPVETDAAALLGATRLHERGIDGSGVGIAVVDTGVTEVVDLAGRVRPGVDLTPERDGVDRFGHGTAVAAAAAGDGAASGGRITGVAPGAHVVPVRIAGADGRSEIARLLIALDWVARHRHSHDIDVVNLSLGSVPFAVDLVDAAVQRLWDLGLVVVVAAGNDGPGTIGTPARNTHVLTVGAVATQGTGTVRDDVVAPWSADGRDADRRRKPDLVAPGVSVAVAGAPGSWAYEEHPASHLGDGYQRASGTSFSTGLLSGAAALVLDARPRWTPDEVLGQLVRDARTVEGAHAGVPWLPAALRTEWWRGPEDGNRWASRPLVGGLLALGPPPVPVLGDQLGDVTGAIGLGSGWYGTGWYGTGWYGTGWYGAWWSGAGSLEGDLTSLGSTTGGLLGGLLGTETLGTGWYGTGWYGTGWYGTGWYGTGWY